MFIFIIFLQVYLYNTDEIYCKEKCDDDNMKKDWDYKNHHQHSQTLRKT